MKLTPQEALEREWFIVFLTTFSYAPGTVVKNHNHGAAVSVGTELVIREPITRDEAIAFNRRVGWRIDTEELPANWRAYKAVAE